MLITTKLRKGEREERICIFANNKWGSVSAVDGCGGGGKMILISVATSLLQRLVIHPLAREAILKGKPCVCQLWRQLGRQSQHDIYFSSHLKLEERSCWQMLAGRALNNSILKSCWLLFASLINLWPQSIIHTRFQQSFQRQSMDPRWGAECYN